MPAPHHRHLRQKHVVPLFFLQYNILIFIMIDRQKRNQLNPGPPPALQPAPQPQPQPVPRRKRKPPNPWVMPWIFQREEKGYHRTLLADLIQTDIPGYNNFVRMQPAFFDFIEECIHYCIKKLPTNFRKPLDSGLKLALTLTDHGCEICLVTLTFDPAHFIGRPNILIFVD